MPFQTQQTAHRPLPKAKDGRLVSPPKSWAQAFFRASFCTRSDDKKGVEQGMRMLTDLARFCPYEPVRRRAQDRVNLELARLAAEGTGEVA